MDTCEWTHLVSTSTFNVYFSVFKTSTRGLLFLVSQWILFFVHVRALSFTPPLLIAPTPIPPTRLICKCDLIIYTCEIAYLKVWYNSFTCVTWIVHKCDMIYWHIICCTHLWHDSSICVLWLISRRIAPYDAFTCLSWLIQMRAMTCSYVCQDSLVRVPGLICVSDSFLGASHHTTCSHVWHDSFKCGPWLIHTCAVIHWHVCQDVFVSLTRF